MKDRPELIKRTNKKRLRGLRFLGSRLLRPERIYLHSLSPHLQRRLLFLTPFAHCKLGGSSRSLCHC